METLHAIARPQADPGRPRRALERAESGPKSEREPDIPGSSFTSQVFGGDPLPPKPPNSLSGHTFRVTLVTTERACSRCQSRSKVSPA
jgi:hypothetical protein